MKRERRRAMPPQVIAMPSRIPMPERQAREGATVWIVVAAAIVAALGLWIWQGSAQRRALESLGAGERRALFLRTEDTLRTACVDPPAALAGYCEQQASFLREFPECDQPCRALVHERLARAQPTR
jgi:hypothetical protein